MRVLLATLFLSVLAAAQNADMHLQGDPARCLYGRSAFVHGYIHGYESGFHVADLEVHMGHNAQPLTHYKAYRDAPGYRSGFGDHKSFRKGYEEGFGAAYNDAINGESFRAVSEVRRAAEGMSTCSSSDKDFDQSLSAGYETGRKEGLSQARVDTRFQAAEQCLAARHNTSYCDAYSRGFNLGYADGVVLNQGLQMQTAQASTKSQVSGTR